MNDIEKKDKQEITPATPDSLNRMFALRRFDDLFTEVHDLFWDRFDKMFEDWDLNMKIFDQLQPKGSFPKVNVIDNEKNYTVEIAVAGFNKDDVQLELKDNALLIKADQSNECKDGDDCKNYLRREIAHRSFRRVISFPAEIDSEAVDAKYDSGIITITVGKVVEEKPESVKIEIK